MKFYLTLYLLLSLSLWYTSMRLKQSVPKPKQSPKYFDYFWVQKLAPTKDAIKYLQNTQRFNERKFIMVSEESVAITQNLDSMGSVESKHFHLHFN